MPHKLIYNWDEIQQYYDTGKSLRECQDKFGFGTTARAKATKAGRFTLRSHQEASLLRRKYLVDPTNNKFSGTTWKGEIACLKFDYRSIEKKLVVSKPIIDCCYDRVVDVDNKLWKVQVKYCGQYNKKSFVAKFDKTCRTRNIRIAYSEDDIDTIVLYCPKNDKIYWLPKDVWLWRQSITFKFDDAIIYEW